MSRNDTSNGWYNYPAQQIASTTSEVASLVPTATGVYPGVPAPFMPLSTSTYPSLLFTSVPSDIGPTPWTSATATASNTPGGSSYDGHPFEIVISGKLTTSATTNFTLNLYQVTYAAISVSPSGTGYPATLTAGPSGTGVTKLTTGTATAVGTNGASVNFRFNQVYLWDSTSGILGAAGAANMYQKGASVSITQSAATVSSLGVKDLNFFPTFTFSASNSPVLLIEEFVINRV